MEAEEKYTKEEFFQKIENGEIKLSVNQIKGLHGGTYSRDPAFYGGDGGEWSNTEFTVGNAKPEPVPTLLIGGVEWFHFPKFLRAAGLLVNESSDISSFEKTVHYSLKRYYCPFDKGTKRVFVRMEALEQLGFSTDKKPIIKRKYNMQFDGVVTLNINIDMVEAAFMRIMSKLKTIEDRAILCDVHRVLKQLQ
jgi:hypothetical protein